MVAVIVSALLGVSGCSSSGSGSGATAGPSSGAGKFVTSVKSDVLLVVKQANFVVTDVGRVAKKATPSMVSLLAEQAKSVEDNLGTLRSNTETAPDASGSDELDFEVAITDLKKAAGDVLAFSGTLNAATGATARADWATGRQEWNAAVTKLWATADAGTAPTVHPLA